MSEAQYKDVFFNSLLIEGSNGLKSQLKDVTTAANHKRTADGVSNLELTVNDPAFNLLRSNILNSRITMQFEDLSFELVQIRKHGEELSLVLEDLLVAEMRRKTEPRKFAPGTVTRVEAARTLLQEIPWARMAVGANKQEKVKIELARGQLSAVAADVEKPTAAAQGVDQNFFSGGGSSAPPAAPKPAKRETTVAEGDREDTWTCLKRWFSEVNWRCYVDKGTLNVGPDSAYTAGAPVYTVTDGMKGLSSYIDFDWDVGKPVATANYSAFIQRYAAPPGSCIELANMGPASGKWIVTETNRDLFNYVTDFKLEYPEPELPEPDPPPVPEAQMNQAAGVSGDFFGNMGAFSMSGGSGGAVGGSGWGWPLNGPITSRFGPRKSPGSGGSRNHKGLDIGAPTGKPIAASRFGVVSHAGPLGGYGNCVVITHAGEGPGAKPYAESRYAHMSTIAVRRGLVVQKGQNIGAVGMTGNTTGPHLHFEICRGVGSGASQIDPLPILNGQVKF